MRHESEFGRRHFRLVMEGKTANPWVHRLSEFSDSVDRFGFLAQSDSDQQAPWDRIEQILTNAIEDSQAREVVFLRLVLGWSQHDTARFVKMNQRRVKRIIAEQTKILRERLRPLGSVARRRPAG
jgi:DNA-directed RNA polymerase specialized sigma24 family protein